MTVIPFGGKPPSPPFPASGEGSSIKVSGEMSPETARMVAKFVAENAGNTRCSHGPMTMELLLKMLLEDVAAAVRDGGNTWQGCHMALVLREHGYVI